MQQRMTFEYSILRGQESNPYEIEPLQINVYTSEYCSFCSDALLISYSAADRISCVGTPVEVVEIPIDDRPSLIEELNIMALPMIQIGHLRIIGLPEPEDVERLIHEVILMGL
ncbi:hypothetical protein EU527_03255 [Candidatus Thorarchaeota archaeon]|nr:MAG: hypothetical protein EU527_03255 [Candidatus Thorarchaeota archaeon]